MQFQLSEIDSTKNFSSKMVLEDYKLACLSRQLSVIGRKEVLKGNAQFGVFGDGMEIAQLAMARCFKEGDWRTGYYRDQTFMLATGMLSVSQFFQQLYGTIDEQQFPASTGRSINNHFATATLDEDGNWLPLSQMKNSASDISPIGAQIPKALGLAQASTFFRNNKLYKDYPDFSRNGNEVAFATIGESGTSEGIFWESINAASILQVPMAVFIWDNGYGISVPVHLQTAKADISKVLEGFVRENCCDGSMVLTVNGWDYPALLETFSKAIVVCRNQHVPVIFHVKELTQPLGHSTSGSHERYKSAKRLQWEKDNDPILKMRQWILQEGYANEKTLIGIEKLVLEEAESERKNTWKAHKEPIENAKFELRGIYNAQGESFDDAGKMFFSTQVLTRKEIVEFAKQQIRNLDNKKHGKLIQALSNWVKKYRAHGDSLYDKFQMIENEKSALKVEPVEPEILPDAELVNGNDILHDTFEALFKKYPLAVTFGEDTGKLGDVNKTLLGLQEKFGEDRIADTGIREASIIGQGIGLALRGFRPIVEIQYLDYLLYGLQLVSDDLATTYYRTAGRQMAPVIVRTRGHRLVGVWHAGSPMGMLLNACRGMHLCVPRNMTQAAGFYNTLMKGYDPAIVIEPLKGYQVKEPKPENIGEFKISLGKPEVLQEGTDVTLVTYGWCVNVAQQAVQELVKKNISVELLDVQTLLPFDIDHVIKKSIEKTSHVVFLDEDVPGGATAYMMQKVLEEQKAFYYLDSTPVCITAKEHRPAYGVDGDYFSKPSVEDVFDGVYAVMHDHNPKKYPEL